MWNRHNVQKMFINIYRKQKIRNWFKYETFIHLFQLKVIRHEEREAQSFYADFSICPPTPPTTTTITCGTQPQNTGLVSASPESQPSSSEARTPLTEFSQISKSSAHTSGPEIICHPSCISYLGFYFDIWELRIFSACAWTPALMLHLTNPCAKRKVLSLTKPKGKIYKTKSLRHYIAPFKITGLKMIKYSITN